METRKRNLTDESQVFTFNSWDDVEWTEEQRDAALETIQKQIDASPFVNEADAVDRVVSEVAASKWNTFYGHHDRWFFKDRKWLTLEFKCLLEAKVILEIGSGVGNSIYPIHRERQILLKQTDSSNDDAESTIVDSNTSDLDASNIDASSSTNNQSYHIYASDFSENAIKLLREFREFDPNHMTAFVWDITDTEFQVPLQRPFHLTVDALLAVFVLSAVDPAKLPDIFCRLAQMLTPGTGRLLFRDYGQHDMTQLRFKPDRLVRPDLYIRGDGTAVHYFTIEEVERLAQQAGLVIEKNIVDRRVLVNRFRKLTMYRVWIQAILRRPAVS